MILLIALGMTHDAFATETLSWRACVEEASKNNAELKSARDTLQSSIYSERGSYGGFFPQLSATLNYSYGTGSTSSSTATGTPVISNGLSTLGGDPDSSYNATVSATQNLFTGLRDKATLEQAKANVMISDSTLSASKAKISFDLKSAYAGLLFAQRSVKLQEQISKRREENLRLVELRFQSGRENKGSLLLSQAYLKQAHYEALQAKNDTEVFQAQLARVLGRDEISDIVLTEDVPLESLTEKPDFKGLALSTPDHRRSVAQEESADAGVTLARSGFFPTLNLNASTSRTGNEWFPKSDRWSVGASISFPFFSGAKDYYGTKSAVATLSAASATRANVDRQIITTLKQNYTGYLQAIEKLKVDESFQEASLKRAEIARSKYNNGLMTFEDWDLIENELIVRERTVLQSQRDRTTAEASWQQTQGRGVIP